MQITAHFYNRNNRWHGKADEGVLFGKVPNAEPSQYTAREIERASRNEIEPQPWQTDTCIGSWHYGKGTIDRHHYQSTKTVMQILIDCVSNNGNPLLSVPLRGDGTPDSDEISFVCGSGLTILLATA